MPKRCRGLTWLPAGVSDALIQHAEFRGPASRRGMKDVYACFLPLPTLVTAPRNCRCVLPDTTILSANAEDALYVKRMALYPFLQAYPIPVDPQSMIPCPGFEWSPIRSQDTYHYGHRALRQRRRVAHYEDGAIDLAMIVQPSSRVQSQHVGDPAASITGGRFAFDHKFPFTKLCATVPPQCSTPVPLPSRARRASSSSGLGSHPPPPRRRDDGVRMGTVTSAMDHDAEGRASHPQPLLHVRGQLIAAPLSSPIFALVPVRASDDACVRAPLSVPPSAPPLWALVLLSISSTSESALSQYRDMSASASPWDLVSPLFGRSSSDGTEIREWHGKEFAAAPGTRQRLVSLSEGRSAQDSRARCTVTAEASSSGIRPHIISWSWSSRTEGRDAGAPTVKILRRRPPCSYVSTAAAQCTPLCESAFKSCHITFRIRAASFRAICAARAESKLADALSSTHPPRVPPPMAAYAPEHGRDLRSRLPLTTASSLRLSSDGGLWRMRMWARLLPTLRDTGDDGHGYGGGSRGSDIWSMLRRAGTTTAGAGHDTSSVAYGGAMTLMPAVRLPPALFLCASRAFSVAVGVSIDEAARSEEALPLLLMRTSLAKVPTTTARTRPITVPSRSATLPVPHTTSNPPLSVPGSILQLKAIDRTMTRGEQQGLVGAASFPPGAVFGRARRMRSLQRERISRRLSCMHAASSLANRRSNPQPGRPATAPILASAYRFRAAFADPPSSSQDTRADPQRPLPFDSGMYAQDDPLPTALAAIRASAPMTWRFQLLVLALLRCSH
ncbi:hypothetical protein DFH09DRAFT_1444609 [Mycena vulgaris]|nr:hypothetical protein DFH09DRAFT_1444609 [Mycena vulgaris]